MTSNDCPCSNLVQTPKSVKKVDDNWRFPTMYRCGDCGEDFHCIPCELNLNT